MLAADSQLLLSKRRFQALALIMKKMIVIADCQ